MKSKLESLLAWLALIGLFVLPVVLLIAISIPGKVAGFKQVAIDRARASLLAAFSDIHPVSGDVGFESKQYGYFVIYSCTNVVAVDGSGYQCALATAPWDHEWYSYGRLAITTNREIIWLDSRHGAKIIPVDYKVSKWRSGY
jgi:hypothetical protein